MRRVLRVLSLILPALLLVPLMARSAWADADSIQADPIDVAEAQGISPDTLTPPCFDQPGAHADATTYYMTFVDRHGTTRQIHVDEYDAKPGPGSFPAMVLVHGGGWIGGCRNGLDSLAVAATQKGFIVFNIDYRLACDPIQFHEIWLCGYTFSTPTNDVRTAVGWVRTNAGTYDSRYNGKVVALGSSAGGNLIYMAGDTGTPGGNRPDVMTALSGPAELGYMSNGHKACDDSANMDLCVKGSKAYMGADLSGTGQCADNWTPGSPACNVSVTSPPPATFISNSTQELVAFTEATDLAAALDRPTPPVAHQLCKVTGSLHGTQLLGSNVYCDDTPGVSVWTNLVNFIKTHL